MFTNFKYCDIIASDILLGEIKMKNYPIVYVNRPLLRNNSSYVPFVAGHLVSEAYLKSETTRYNEDGTKTHEYEVEYIGYTSANVGLKEGQEFFVAMGDHVKVNAIFDYYNLCKDYTAGLNEQVKKEILKYATPKSRATTEATHAKVLKLIDSMEQAYLIDAENESE